MPPRPKQRRKVKVGVSLDPALHAWAMARVGPGKEFSTLTHAIERGLALLAEREGGHPAARPSGEEPVGRATVVRPRVPDPVG